MSADGSELEPLGIVFFFLIDFGPNVYPPSHCLYKTPMKGIAQWAK